jgi:translocation and assembly module TamA
VSFTTDLGPGLSVEWEHRNMRRMGERLNFLGEIEGKQQRLRGLYRKPDFKRIDQDLIFSSELRSKKTDNFSEKSLSASTLIDRKINANLRVSYGGSIKYLATSQSDNNQNRTLISTPVKLRWSTTDDPLDPTTGIIFTTNGSPYLAVPMADLIYLKNRTTLSAYKSITNDKTLLLAGKITIGSIIGASRSNIPPPDRFYAGSESLLRGYDRLSVSPLSPKGKPLGGRSMAIGNIELRVRASENLGWIAFFEIGNVWSTVLPHFGGKLLKSTGAGIRYRTPIGPVRLDVAFPLNPRKGIDDSWEAYLNIGQAF